MLKTSEKRRSIYKEFPTQLNHNIINDYDSDNRQYVQAMQIQPVSMIKAGSEIPSQSKQQQQGIPQNQKLQILARLIPEQNKQFSQQQNSKNEGIRQDNCIFKVSENEIQIIEPDDKKIIDIDGFQKRERVQNSPQYQNILGNSQQNSQNNMQKNSQNSINQFDNDKQRIMKGYSTTPEIEKNDTNKRFQSPTSTIRNPNNNSTDNKFPNTFTFDNIYEESLSDDAFFNQMKQQYLNCLKKGKNLILLNLNRSVIDDSLILKYFINGLQKLKQSTILNSYASEKAQFFLQSYEIIHSNNEKKVLFEQQPIQQQQDDDIINIISNKMSSVNRKSLQQCSVHNFYLFDDNKLINEIIIIDMISILDKKSSSQQFQYQNTYLKDLLNILNFQPGTVNPSDLFQSLFLQKYKLSDELIILANFRMLQQHFEQNYYLLRFTQMLFKSKQYLESMFIQICLIQNEQIHRLLNRDPQFDNLSELPIKDEIIILSKQNQQYLERIKLLTADSISHQVLNQQLNIKVQQFQKDLQSSREIIDEQKQSLAAKKKKISEQTTKIDDMRKSFGYLENFDKSMMADSKNKSFIHSNFYSQRKTKDDEVNLDSKFTQTDNLNKEDFQNNQNSIKQVQNHFCKKCKTQIDQTYQNQAQNNYNQKQSNILYEQISSDIEQQQSSNNQYDDESQITPNRYLSHLDDILSNMESKRSVYFSPRNINLANIALYENQENKHRIVLKDQEIERLNQRIQELDQQLDNQTLSFTYLENKRYGDLQMIEKLQQIFEKKLLNNQSFFTEIISFQESEIKEMRNIIEFGFVSMHSQIIALKKDIKIQKQEKQSQIEVLCKKTEDVIKQLENKIKIKNDKINQYQEVLEKFGQNKISK